MFKPQFKFFFNFQGYIKRLANQMKLNRQFKFTEVFADHLLIKEKIINLFSVTASFRIHFLIP